MKNFDFTFFLFLSLLVVIAYVPFGYMDSPEKMEKDLEKNVLMTSMKYKDEKNNQKIISNYPVAAFYIYQ